MGEKRGGGRRKGDLSKTTRMLSDAIILAAEEAGDEISPRHPSGKLVAYLKHAAQTQPVAFVGLLGKILPLQVNDSDGRPTHAVAIKFD